MLKLGFVAWLALGISVAVIILSYAYFWKYQPDLEEATDKFAQAQELHDEAEKLPQSQKRQVQAAAAVNATFAKWAALVPTKTPTTSLKQGGIDLAEDPNRLMLDVKIFRDSIQKAVNKQVQAGGVKVINGPTIPLPPSDPNSVVSGFFNFPAEPFPVVIFDLGQITVQGTYQQIEANMKAWTYMPNYLAVADGLSLTGTSPILTGTYNLSMVGFIRGTVVYPSINAGNLAGGAAPSPNIGGGGGGGNNDKKPPKKLD